MLLYLSSSIYIFTALEISLPHFSIVGIYRRGAVWGRGVTYGKGPTSVPLDSSGVIVWTLNSCYS